MEPTYKLEELARAADISPRTVRYYVQRGLLPAPAFRGRDTAYTAEHLARLLAIRKLQDEYLPLDAIAVELERRTAEDILRTEAKAKVRTQVVPLPPFAPAPASASWRRYAVRDGVEIHVRDDISPSLGNLIAELTRLLKPEGPYR
jgi:DNA-binding transcriptional MerR regulator